MIAGRTSVFSGKKLNDATVLLIHPAWHSCGSYDVFVAQAEAYRALGAKVFSLAVADQPHSTLRAAEAAYDAATGDMKSTGRFFAAMSLRAVIDTRFLRATKDWLHGNYAAMLLETTRAADIPNELYNILPDLIHCNHFFCMPIATEMGRKFGCAIILDTHDLQARQYVLRNTHNWALPPRASYESMLALELAQLRKADLLIHLNTEEAETFGRLLPDKHHALLFPAILPMPIGSGGDIIMVASSNYPNYLDLKWFLTEVMPHLEGLKIRIVGNIDRMMRRRAPRLYRRYAESFTGFVPQLAEVYENAKAIILPTTSGFGISIKAIEALSSGVPLIATRYAFRGMGIDPAGLRNVTLAENPAEFASAIRLRAETAATSSASVNATSDTRQLYDRLFAPDVYRRKLSMLVAAVLEHESAMNRA